MLKGWVYENGQAVKFDVPITISDNTRTIRKVYPSFQEQLTIQYRIGLEESGYTVYTTDVVKLEELSSYELIPSVPIPRANRYFLHWSETADN